MQKSAGKGLRELAGVYEDRIVEEFWDHVKEVWPDIDIEKAKAGEGGIVLPDGRFIPANQVFQYLFGDIV